MNLFALLGIYHSDQMVTSKLELLVDFGRTPDETALSNTLKELRSQDGVTSADFKDGAFLVETTLPNQVLLDMVSQSTGRRTVLQGFGDSHSAAAVVSSQGPGPVGVVRFQQTGPAVVIDGTIDRLTPGKHGLHVTEDGDISQGCAALSGHYNPSNTHHGCRSGDALSRHAGDLGNIEADDTGRASFRIVDKLLKIPDIIGRCIAVTENADDLGKGYGPNSLVDGNSGKPIACGIIARSAGVLSNPKRICACDGVPVWEERDRPLAGQGRSDKRAHSCCGVSGTENVQRNGHCFRT